ncbi:10A19I.15, partial [Zea mays]
MADMVSEVAGQGARPALRWTAVMSRFVLHRFVDLIGNGVKTDTSFKEIHLNSVAKNVSEFYGQEWRSRWVKVCKLKDISGALWDEDNFVISLEEGHYAAYIKDHPKDVDYLNRPIENYMPMQIIFGSGVAT